MDAALHQQRRGSKVRTGVLGAPVHSAVVGGEITRVFIFNERRVRVVLLDVEGTTTPVAFVYQTLFPYAHKNLEGFLAEHSKEPEIRSLVEDLRAQWQMDAQQGMEPPAWEDAPHEARLHSAAEYGQWLMAKDSKCTPLKSLQGRIWQKGFCSGELNGEVYRDVPEAFERWQRQDRQIAIYSSGSVLAQQLLFRTVLSGDLTPHIAGFFDTRVGTKVYGESYRRIAEELKRAPREILFVSDTAKEIQAARAVGMHAILCDRAGRAPSTPPDSATIRSFDQIFPR